MRYGCGAPDVRAGIVNERAVLRLGDDRVPVDLVDHRRVPVRIAAGQRGIRDDVIGTVRRCPVAAGDRRIGAQMRCRRSRSRRSRSTAVRLYVIAPVVALNCTLTGSFAYCTHALREHRRARRVDRELRDRRVGGQRPAEHRRLRHRLDLERRGHRMVVEAHALGRLVAERVAEARVDEHVAGLRAERRDLVAVEPAPRRRPPHPARSTSSRRARRRSRRARGTPSPCCRCRVESDTVICHASGFGAVSRPYVGGVCVHQIGVRVDRGAARCPRDRSPRRRACARARRSRSRSCRRARP